MVDSTQAGRTSAEVVPFARRDVPIVADVDAAHALGATCALIGVAPAGGKLTDAWKLQLLRAMELGMDVEAGLHTLLNDDPALVAAAAQHGVQLRDLRTSPKGLTIPRADLSEAPARPLDKELFAGCIDAVGGTMLANVLTKMSYGGSIAAVGLAGGNKLDTTVIPFLLRGVNLLGIDSVMRPYADRAAAWQRLVQDLPLDKLEAMIQPATLADLPKLGKAILKGQVKGRVVVEIG